MKFPYMRGAQEVEVVEVGNVEEEEEEELLVLEASLMKILCQRTSPHSGYCSKRTA